MANFLTFEENQVLINNDLFPANGITLQLSANTIPVKDIYGNLLYYSPAGPIQGTVGLNFFLTGALPSYLRVENQDESPIKIAFNTIVIPDCYLTNVSLSVKPFEPIPVRADLVFYHGVRAMNTDPIVLNTFATNLAANGIAKSNNLFNSNLKTLNGTASYILTENRSSFTENPADFVVTDFDYQFSVERVPILRVGEIFPTRVAMKEANAEFSITANNIDGYLDIHGNSAEFSAVLRDSASLSTYEEIQLTGIIVDQSYEISDESYGLSKIKMIQALNRKRSPITIPMEVSDPNIINAPTNNPINPPNTPPTTVIIDKITEEKPKPQDPEKGTTTTPTPESDNDEYYYFTTTVDLKFNSTGPNMIANVDGYSISKNFVDIKAMFSNTFSGSIYITDNADPQISRKYYFRVLSVNPSTRYLEKEYDAGGNFTTTYVKNDALVILFMVNKNFKEFFNLSKLFNDKQNDNYVTYTFIAPYASDTTRTISKTYLEFWTPINNASVGGGQDGTIQKPFIIDLNNVIFWNGVGH